MEINKINLINSNIKKLGSNILTSKLANSNLPYNKNISTKLGDTEIIPYENIFKGKESNSLWVYSHTLNMEDPTKIEGLRLVNILPINILPEKNQDPKPLERLEPIGRGRLEPILPKGDLEESLKILRKKLAFRKLLAEAYYIRKEEEAQAELLRQMTRKQRIAYLRDNCHLILLAILLGLITLKCLVKLIKLKKERIKKFLNKLRSFSENVAYQIFFVVCLIIFGSSFIILPSVIAGVLSFFIMRNISVLLKSALSMTGIIFEEYTIANNAITLITSLFYGIILTYISDTVDSM